MADDGTKKEGIGGKSPAVSLQFINMNAATAAERQRNQKVVRSTAMKSFRRRQKTQRQEEGGESREKEKKGSSLPKSRPSKSANGGASIAQSASAAATHKTLPLIPYSEASWLVESPSSSSSDSSAGEEGSIVGVEIQTIRSEHMRVSDLRTSTTTSPRTLLGAGRVDPFQTYPVYVQHTSHAPELIDHSMTVLWRGLRPPEDNGAVSKLGTAWRGKMAEHPIVMNALLFGAQAHKDVLRGPRLSVDSSIRLFYKLQTMRLLNEELKNPEKTPLDDIILAVLALSTNEVETTYAVKKERSPFNSPLAGTQWLDVYGGMPHLPAHTTAMRSLVARRGGLESIELEGLAEVLSFSDILGATQSLKKPHWPLLKRTSSTEDIHIPEILRLSLRRLGQGFEELMPIGANEKVLDVIKALVDLTIIIDCHCRGVKHISNMVQFIDKRNAVQHQLISLPLGEELTPQEVGSINIYESVRLATLIYSAAVTFPLPPLTGIFHRLACTLRDVLEKSKSDPCWQSSPKALLWILVLGGIAASGTERPWYVQVLSTVSMGLELSTWYQVSAELENYLWLESACDSAGRSIWMEVEHENTRGAENDRLMKYQNLE